MKTQLQTGKNKNNQAAKATGRAQKTGHQQRQSMKSFIMSEVMAVDGFDVHDKAKLCEVVVGKYKTNNRGKINRLITWAMRYKDKFK